MADEGSQIPAQGQEKELDYGISPELMAQLSTTPELKAELLKMKNETDAKYFNCYSQLDIHKKMLSDKVRTGSYEQAIMGNPSLFKNLRVMDVGCGTGILSLFAAKAGAEKVYAVEGSPRMAAIAATIVKENGFDGIIEVCPDRVEELDIKDNRVDVLVSEWMGTSLLSESMLCSVIKARDMFLKPGGAILPDKAVMFVAGFGKGATNLPFWENVYGFSMSSAGTAHVEDDYCRLITDRIIDVNDLVTGCSILEEFDLSTIKLEELDFESQVQLKPLKTETSHCHGLVFWFETNFTSRFCPDKTVALSTSPSSPETHWCQTIISFLDPITLALEKPVSSEGGVGTALCPATELDLEISIINANRVIGINYLIYGTSFEGTRVAIQRSPNMIV